MKVRYRPTWRQLAPTYVVTLVANALFRLDAELPRLLDVGAALVVAAVATFALRSIGVDADRTGITVVRLRRKNVPWSRVTGVERVDALATRSLRLRLYDGGVVPLPAPSHTRFLSPDPAFEDKARTIEHLWREAER